MGLFNRRKTEENIVANPIVAETPSIDSVAPAATKVITKEKV